MAECSWQSNCLDISLASAETPYSKKMGAMAMAGSWNYKQLDCLSSDSPGNEASTASWVKSSVSYEGISQQGRFACTSSCSWILFLVFGNDIYYLHYFSKSLLTGTFLSWILKHAVVKSTIWINFFFTHYNGHWLQKTTTKSRNPST